jgi:malonyl-CoA O-methyltransferase
MTTLSPAEAYRLLAPTYDSLPNPLLSLEQRTTSKLLPSLAGLRVADIAAGTGRWARYCQRHGARAIAIDFCADMLARAPNPRVLADARQLPFRDASVDVAILSFGLGYAPDCLPELARITRLGGTVLVSDIHPDALRRGWRRSFRAQDEVIEAASHRYDIGELQISGLQLQHLAEPHFAEMERRIFAQAGKLNSFDALQPAIFVAQWLKL